MKRYFIYSFSYSYSGGGKSGYSFIVSDNCYPYKNSILNKHGIPSNIIHSLFITEVKSVKDISDFLGINVKDEVNYPFIKK